MSEHTRSSEILNSVTQPNGYKLPTTCSGKTPLQKALNQIKYWKGVGPEKLRAEQSEVIRLNRHNAVAVGASYNERTDPPRLSLVTLSLFASTGLTYK